MLGAAQLKDVILDEAVSILSYSVALKQGKSRVAAAESSTRPWMVMAGAVGSDRPATWPGRSCAVSPKRSQASFQSKMPLAQAQELTAPPGVSRQNTFGYYRLRLAAVVQVMASNDSGCRRRPAASPISLPDCGLSSRMPAGGRHSGKPGIGHKRVLVKVGSLAVCSVPAESGRLRDRHSQWREMRRTTQDHRGDSRIGGDRANPSALQHP